MGKGIWPRWEFHRISWSCWEEDITKDEVGSWIGMEGDDACWAVETTDKQSSIRCKF